MKTLSLTFAFLAGLPLAAAAQVSKEDIKKLTAAGISDDVILSYVKANGPVAKLSAEDVIELKQAGASEKVLNVILSGPPAAQAPAPATTAVVRTTPYYYQPSTVVYDNPDYYYPATYSYGAYASTYYPRSTYWPSYSYSYYPRYYSSWNCYPRSYYSYPRSYYSVGWSSRGSCSPRGSFGVSYYRR
jgi:hypothetical protein